MFATKCLSHWVTVSPESDTVAVVFMDSSCSRHWALATGQDLFVYQVLYVLLKPRKCLPWEMFQELLCF